MTLDLRGAHTALVTPFNNGQVDVDALAALVQRQVAGGINGVVPCGTTGESVTLAPEEHKLVVRTVVEQVKRRVPVIAGASTNDTKKSIQLAKLSKEAGADALLLVCPYYNKPTQRGLVAHMNAIIDATDLPVVLYNIPGRTGVDLSLDALEELLKRKEVIAIKEATGNVVKAQAICARFGSRIQVLSGDDALTLAMLAVGGVGVVSVTSNFDPTRVAQVISEFHAGNLEKAKALHHTLLPLHNAMFLETNPGPVKALLAEESLLRPSVRLPLVWPTTETIAELKRIASSTAAR